MPLVCVFPSTTSAKPTGTPTATASAKPIGTPEPGEILTLYYNDGNAEQVREQLLDSDVPVHVIVEDSVTSIKGMAFSFCKRLTSIMISDSVIGIGDSAFYACSRLTSTTCNTGCYTGTGELLASCCQLGYPNDRHYSKAILCGVRCTKLFAHPS